MNNEKMISMKEVLELTHHKMGYGKDDLSKEIYQVLSENGNDHYLIGAKKMREYIEKYIDREYKKVNGCFPVTDEETDTIIKVEGSTQGTKYSKNDILKMLEDEYISKLLFNRLKRRSTYFGSTPIASELSKYEIAVANGIITDKGQLSFFEMIKQDSLGDMKEKLNILKKAIEVNESIGEINDKEAEETIKDLEEMARTKQHIKETMKQIEAEVLERKKELEWEKIFEEALQLEIELEKNYCYLSSDERIELESKYEDLHGIMIVADSRCYLFPFQLP